MEDEKKHKFTAKIADVEPLVFNIPLSEEPIFRKAVLNVNKVYRDMRAAQSDKPTEYVLAKVALAFAELYERKVEQMKNQTAVLNDIEAQFDNLLLAVES